MNLVTYIYYCHNLKSINGQKTYCFRFTSIWWLLFQKFHMLFHQYPFPKIQNPAPLLTAGGKWLSLKWTVRNLTCNSDLNWCIWPISFCISSLCISFSCRRSSSSMLLAVLLSRPSKPDPSFKLLINFSFDYYIKKKRNILKQSRD